MNSTHPINKLSGNQGVECCPAEPRGAVLTTRGDLGVGALGGDPVTGSGTQLAAEGPC